MSSGVKSRIASFEAASSKGGGAPSPSRPISSQSPSRSRAINSQSPSRPVNNYHRPRTTFTPQKTSSFSKEQEQQQVQQQQETQKDPIQTQQHKSNQFIRRGRETKSRSSLFRHNQNASTADTNLKTGGSSIKSNGQEHKNNSFSKSASAAPNVVESAPYAESTLSTTSTASENRKSRIRSQQKIRENNNAASTTNLSEKRRQRRILQSQRRARLTSKGAASNDTANKQTDIGATAAGRTSSPIRTPVDNRRVPDSPGVASTGSNDGTGTSRRSKLSRLHRRPLSIQQRQSSSATNATRTSGAHSVATALVRNTASSNNTAAVDKLGGRGAKPEIPDNTSVTRSVDKLMSAGMSSKHRRQRQESPKNSSPSQRSVQSTKSSRTASNYGGRVDQQQLNASLEAPTDDDATLTSVHRIMEGSNSKHQRKNQNPNHSYETLQSSQNTPYDRHSVKYENHNSYDSSVGPSWKPNRGAGNRNTIWKEDEKSEKVGYGTNGGRVLRTEYSSDYDMDDKTDRSRQSAHFTEGPVNSRYHNTSNMNSNGTFQNHMGSNNNRRIDDDDRTFDYGDRDDDSNGGTSYVRRRIEAEQRRVRLAASSNTNDLNNTYNSNLEQGIHQAGSINGNNGEPMLLSRDDMEHLTMNDSPSLRLGAGVAAVATVGLCVGGPVGLLAGVAAGGLGFGFMQIPEEERNKIQAKAEKAVSNLQEKACDASEAMTSSCINTYQDSGVAEHVPHCISSNIADQLVPNCPTGGTAKSETYGNSAGGMANSAQVNGAHGGSATNVETSSASPTGPLMEQKASSSMPHNERTRPKKVACLRNVRILPIPQIHGLEPSSQPRAWLDVVASANTSSEQKNEAMEEILLLAKDKRRAKIFLDEGILDYIIWTLSRYIEKVEATGKTTEWAFPGITPNEKTAANLAAMCCVTLGKAHCAAIHTEGDLLLMSMYERGTVPEERQVAQMLHEVPHHARVTKTNDPTIVEPSKEVFAPRQLTLSQAEELAKSIKLVADGRM